MSQSLSSRRRTVAFAAVLVPTVLLTVVGVRTPLAGPAAAQATQQTQQPAIGVIETAENLAECAPTEVGATPAGLAPAAFYQIVGADSAARYRVTEELVSVGVQDAVGETNAIIGQIMVGDDGRPLACSRFDVDLRTLQSDEARRDNYLYTNTLETETYPLATFVLRAVAGLDGALAEGEETTFTLIGDLTLHGVTNLVAWETTATVEDGALIGTAATTFQMPDYAIEPPRVPVVVSLDETIRLEVDITAEQAA